MKDLFALFEKEGVNSFETFKNSKLLEHPYNFTYKEGKKDTPHESLYLIHSTKNSDNRLPEVRQCNGLILEKSDNKVICGCINKVVNMDSGSQYYKGHYQRIKNYTNGDNCKVIYAEDLTVVRIYNYKSKNYVATTRCIDASNSYWTSKKSYAELVSECIDLNEKDLLPDTTYIFSLSHPEDEKIIKIHTKQLELICAFDNTDLSYLFEPIQDKKKYKGALTLDQVIEKTFKVSFKNLTYGLLSNGELEDLKRYRGYILLIQNDMYLFDFDTFREAEKIKNNARNIDMRYLELFIKNDMDSFYKLSYYLPSSYLRKLIHCYHNMCRYIQDIYYHRYVKKDGNANTPPEMIENFERTLKQLHALYLKTKTPVSYHVVHNHLVNLPAHVVYNLFEFYCGYFLL